MFSFGSSLKLIFHFLACFPRVPNLLFLMRGSRHIRATVTRYYFVFSNVFDPPAERSCPHYGSPSHTRFLLGTNFASAISSLCCWIVIDSTMSGSTRAYPPSAGPIAQPGLGRRSCWFRAKSRAEGIEFTDDQRRELAGRRRTATGMGVRGMRIWDGFRGVRTIGESTWGSWCWYGKRGSGHPS